VSNRTCSNLAKTQVYFNSSVGKKCKRVYSSLDTGRPQARHGTSINWTPLYN